MKDKGPEVFKLIKTNSALDFRKNNTSSVNILEGIIFNQIQRNRVSATTEIRGHLREG